ncbi:TPA: hypothetical protein ACRZ2J_004903 [Vibrio campbellii]|uniref:Uncharacterized protein n=2 Tax=Vibrionaceae TaxID=641 RepID=A0A6M1RTS0_9GAMM|nr:hypothetical protein [Grimontia sedimenti]EKO3804729.1 hypothetical protein [Vibrio harveyi]EKO3843935.1 hypothetical protein [Vibrio harveyi]EKY4197935.1 hypothetical protein [Vibrio harveyi]NGN99367.1 hypothetical protein [Grimontia sedimenti]HDM8199148.1 hypothetical protein [Vibrio harveyi]
MPTEIILLVTFGGVAALLVSKINEYVLKRFFTDEVTLEDRIDALTKELRHSSQLISDIEVEVSQRKKVVEELKESAEQYKHLASLDIKQVQAVSQALEKSTTKGNKKAAWLNFIQSTFFFILGIVATHVMQNGI